MGILDKILGGIAGPAVDYFKQRAQLKSTERIRKLELDDAIHKRRIELISQGLAADASWELEQIRTSGWKDEWVLILLSIPLVMVFLPFSQPAVLNGFEALMTTPDWYRWLIMMIFTAVYGIRIWRRQQSDT